MKAFEVTQSTNRPWTRWIWWISVGGMAVLSSIRLIIGAVEAPEGSQLEYYLFVLLGFLIVLVFAVLLSFIFWLAGHKRVGHILTESPGAPVAYVAGLAEDGNEVLVELGATYSFRKPSHAFVSFGATPAGLQVYRRFNHEIARLRADRIDDIGLERRALASGPEREVISFSIRDETGTLHKLSFTIFSPGKLFLLAYSQRYMQSLLAEFRQMLGVKDRAA